jgi:putative transposase
LELLTQGIHLVSTDEMSGIQALERLHPALPMRPRQVERIEFEYIRHGTQTLLGNWHIARGQLINPTIGATRTKKISKTILLRLSTPRAGSWVDFHC